MRVNEQVQLADADPRDPPELLHLRSVGAGQRRGGSAEPGRPLRVVQHPRSRPGEETQWMLSALVRLPPKCLAYIMVACAPDMGIIQCLELVQHNITGMSKLPTLTRFLAYDCLVVYEV